MAGERGQRPESPGPAGAEEDEDALPPFLPGWRGFYALVIVNLVFLTLLFIGIQAWFE